MLMMLSVKPTRHVTTNHSECIRTSNIVPIPAVAISYSPEDVSATEAKTLYYLKIQKKYHDFKKYYRKTLIQNFSLKCLY